MYFNTYMFVLGCGSKVVTWFFFLLLFYWILLFLLPAVGQECLQAYWLSWVQLHFFILLQILLFISILFQPSCCQIADVI